MTRGSRIPMPQAMAVSSYPPIGQVTQSGEREITFYVMLETEQHRASQAWQVALWHSRGGDGQSWEETLLHPCRDGDGPFELDHLANSSSIRLFFRGDIIIHPSLRFTIKVRETPHDHWRWIRDEQGSDDGVVISAAADMEANTEPLEDIIKGLNPDLVVKSHISQSPRTQLWTFETTVKGADGNLSSMADVELGTPWGSFLR